MSNNNTSASVPASVPANNSSASISAAIAANKTNNSNNNKGEKQMSNNKVKETVINKITKLTENKLFGEAVEIGGVVLDYAAKLAVAQALINIVISGDLPTDLKVEDFNFDENIENYSEGPMRSILEAQEAEKFAKFLIVSYTNSSIAPALILVHLFDRMFPGMGTMLVKGITRDLILLGGGVFSILTGKEIKVLKSLANSKFLCDETEEEYAARCEEFVASWNEAVANGLAAEEEGIIPKNTNTTTDNPAIPVIPVIPMTTTLPNNWKHFELEELHLNNVVEGTVEEVIKFSTYGNPEGDSTLTIQYNVGERTLSWNNTTYTFNNYILRVQKNINLKGLMKDAHTGKVITKDTYLHGDREEYEITVASIEGLIAEILTTVRKKAQMKAAETFLQSLVGTILVTEWETEAHNPNNYNKAAIQIPVSNIIDANQLKEEGKVVAYQVNRAGEIVLRKESETKSNWVEGCLAASWELFGPTLPDKTNTKCGYTGDYLGVMGISADGTTSMVDADKGGKLLSRHAMVGDIRAEVEDPKLDRLLAEASNNKFAGSYGMRQDCLFLNTPLLSLAVGDGGFVTRTQVTYTINKRIEGELNIDLLLEKSPTYAATLVGLIPNLRLEGDSLIERIMKDVKKALYEEYGSGKVIEPGASIEWKGQVILTNTTNLELVLAPKGLKVTKGRRINSMVRSIKCTFATKSRVTDYNVKARGQWFKGMSTRNDDVVVEGCTSQFIFNDNSVKNRKATLIRMWAGATDKMVSFCKDGEFRFVEYNGATGNFDMGSLVDFVQVEEELKSISKSFNVSIKTTALELADFKASCPDAFIGVEETIEGEFVTLHFVAQGVQAPLVFAIELSSVPENFSPNRKLSPIQSELLCTFAAASKTARRTVEKRAIKIARTIELAASTKVDGDFKLHFDNIQSLGSREVLAHILTVADKAHNPRDFFRVLAQKFPNGFRISGNTNIGSRPWNIVIPTHVLSVYGAFNKSGWSDNATVQDTYAFLTLLKEKEVKNAALTSQVVADYAMSLRSALNGWRKDIVHSSKGFVKGGGVFYTHGMKVLSNPLAGYEKHGDNLIPVILVDETNPLVTGEAVTKDGSSVKPLADGDVVFFYRNPMIDLTPGIIRISKSNTVCGKFTCAVSPSVLAWSSQTDNDGDTLWVVPAKQVGIDNIENSSEVASTLMNHPLVGKEIAVDTMAAFKCEDLLAGILKSRDPFSVVSPTRKVKTSIDFLPNNQLGVNGVVSLEPNELTKGLRGVSSIVEEATAVAHHYRVRVGQGYSAMFNAYSSFISKSMKGEELTCTQLQGIKACSFVLYEEWGLAGYTKENEANFVGIYNVAKGQLGIRKKAPLSAIAEFAKDSKGLQSLNSFAEAGKYVAQQMIQSSIERGESIVADGEIKTDALCNGLFRTLTKGAFSFDGETINPIFVDAPVDESRPFGKALVAWSSFAKGGLKIS